MEDHIIARVFRFNPATDTEPRFDEFKLPYSPGATVLGALRYIHENLDSTLAFRNYHCGALICGCCQLTINGKRTKSCSAVIHPGETVVIEPFDRTRVIRDLAVIFD
jgi:succinate dehydrogenase / fumarate reductase, iron-sulfur subunit